MEQFHAKSGNICVNLSSSAVSKYCHLPNGVALSDVKDGPSNSDRSHPCDKDLSGEAVVP
jgi:hypothetical protein